MNNKTAATLVTLLMIFATFAVVIPGSGTDAAETSSGPITVNDGMGNEVTFESPVNKIMTIGKGPTSTTIELGCLDKIVVADKYSATDTDPVFKDFKAKVDAGDILAHGTMYSSGANDLRADMAQGVDRGFDINKDAVVVVATSNADLIQSIRDMGFKNILWWSSITDYDEIIDYVSVMSRVLLGYDAPAVESMRYVHNHVLTEVNKLDTPQDAFYVRMDKSTLKVGNYGSLANSLLVEAGANVITLDKDNPNSLYEVGIPTLFDTHPDAMVFADDNICGNPDNLQKLKAQIPEGKSIFRIDPLWNNYSIKSADGLWAIACELYPTVFSGEPPAVPETIKIVDGEGTEFNFYGPVNKIMTIGKGPTSTAITIGCLDKIIVADKYSATDADPVFTEFKAKVAAGEIFAGGTVYSSGSAQLKTDMAQAVDAGFDQLNDAIVITSSINAELLQSIRDMGFKNILRWNSITEYDQLIDYVSVMSQVLLGEESQEVQSMKYVYDYVQSKLPSITEKQDAFYVNIKSGDFVVGNYGSLANSLLMEAGANVITLDKDNPNPTYQTAVPALFDDHPKAMVFADDSICKSEENLTKLKTQIPPGTEVFRIDPLWNNYSIMSSDGLWAIACQLYPTVFSGDIPTGLHDVTIGSFDHGTLTVTPASDVKQGVKVTIDVTPDTGYTLTALSYNSNRIPIIAGQTQYSFVMPDADVTLMAEFQMAPVTHTVTFDMNGHGPQVPAQTVVDGSMVVVPTDPVILGFAFEGWYTEAACTNAYAFTTPVTSDITLYAKWTAVGPAPENNNDGWVLAGAIIGVLALAAVAVYVMKR